MRVVATAGHVDHGKSTLVRALTGIEPDRWEEEHRRGMTIDLGYAWTTLPSGEQIAFVDVPGHQRFIGNMLAGLGPAPAVVFVVAADEGWRRQSEEHLAAVDALGLAHGLLVVTRSDLRDPAPALAEARAHLEASSLAGCEALSVSARTGAGIEDLRSALDRLVSAIPAPRTQGRTRLWVDRAFTIRGAGTVVTGTLGEGTLRTGEDLALRSADGQERRVSVRALQSLEQPLGEVPAVARVAVNLRGVARGDVARGDVLLTPDAWRVTTSVDVVVSASVEHELPAHVMVHVGTVAVEARVRPLGIGPDGRYAVRLGFRSGLTLSVGDRVILRDAGSRAMTGALVVDADPPPLARRGAAARRAQDVLGLTGTPDLAREVARRAAMTVDDAARLGITLPEGEAPAAGVTQRGRWLVHDAAWTRWREQLRAAVTARAAAEPLDPVLTLEAARAAAGLPDRSLLLDLVVSAGLVARDGRVSLPGGGPTLAPDLEAAVCGIEERLGQQPFASPEQRDLDAAGLGPREIAAAVRAGRLLRLPPDVLLLPTAPARAMRLLAGLPQPFTTSEARVALDSTRRTVIPLLEHLDGRGWTRRIDGSRREVRR